MRVPRILALAVVLSLAFVFGNAPVFAAPFSVFSTNFNSGAPPEFSGVTTTTGVQGYVGLGTGLNVFGGNFLRNTSALPPLPTSLILTGLPPIPASTSVFCWPSLTPGMVMAVT